MRGFLNTATSLLVAAVPTILGQTTGIPSSTRPSLDSLPATAIPGLPTSCVSNSASAAPSQTVLSSVRTATAAVTHSPFGITYVNQDYAFVSLAYGNTSTLGVLDTSNFEPKLVHQIVLPASFTYPGGSAGLTLTRDKRHVFVAAGPGAIVLDTGRAIAGRADSVIGMLNDTSVVDVQSTQVSMNGAGVGAIQITLSEHDRYIFISQEYGSAATTQFRGNIDVWKVSNTTYRSTLRGQHIGFLELGYDVVGSALSPCGTILYATSECVTDRCTTNGAISIIDVRKLKTKPELALKASIAAGCSPVRAIVSRDGKTLWVTARESDLLLAYDTERLVSNPARSLIAQVTVGTAPIDLTFVRGESRILTADSNRFDNENATTGITVVDVEEALKGGDANLGRIPTGLFPREFAVSPNGHRVLVADYLSNAVQVVDVDSLP